MIYTSGVVKDITRAETLEELQDNKLKLVCEKLDLQPTDKLLDIGCGWGTLAAFAGKNYDCDVTGGESEPCERGVEPRRRDERFRRTLRLQLTRFSSSWWCLVTLGVNQTAFGNQRLRDNG